MEQGFVFFNICSEISEVISFQLFEKVFGEYASKFWDFWVHRAGKNRILFFYENIDDICHGIGRTFGAKNKFVEIVNELSVKIAEKHGYKLVKIE